MDATPGLPKNEVQPKEATTIENMVFYLNYSGVLYRFNVDNKFDFPWKKRGCILN